MNTIFLLFCKIGLHQWVYGRGWIDYGNGVSGYHDGDRCCWCGKKGKQRSAK